jgi:hypothetical protein
MPFVQYFTFFGCVWNINYRLWWYSYYQNMRHVGC